MRWNKRLSSPSHFISFNTVTHTYTDAPTPPPPPPISLLPPIPSLMFCFPRLPTSLASLLVIFHLPCLPTSHKLLSLYSSIASTPDDPSTSLPVVFLLPKLSTSQELHFLWCSIFLDSRRLQSLTPCGVPFFLDFRRLN